MIRKRPNLFGAGPVFPVRDVASAVEYYCSTLGFERDFVLGDPPDHGSVTRCSVGVQFTKSPEGFVASSFPGWTYVFVDQVDALYAEYVAHRVAITRPIMSHEHGMREFEILDLDGFRLRFGAYE